MKDKVKKLQSIDADVGANGGDGWCCRKVTILFYILWLGFWLGLIGTHVRATVYIMHNLAKYKKVVVYFTHFEKKYPH